MKAGFFHHLPSGGGVRVAGQQLFNLRNRFDWVVRVPAGSARLLPRIDVDEFVYPFPENEPLSGWNRLLAPVLLWKKLSRLNAVCREIGADFKNDQIKCILAHNSMTIAAPPVLLYDLCPSVYFCHEYPRHVYERNIHKTRSLLGDLLISPLLLREKRQDAAAVKNTDLIATNSFFMARKMQAVYSRTPVVSYPGIDVEFFSPGSNGNQGFLLSVGALSPFKGHHLVVLAVSFLPEKIRPSLVVVADRKTGKYKEHLRRSALKRGVQLTIRSGISDVQLRGLYRSAAITVCASENEPYGLVPLEAMGCHCPVLAVQDGGFPENVKDGVTGRIVPRSARDIARGIEEMLGSSKTQMRDLTLRARDFVVSRRSMQMEAEVIGSLMDGLTGDGSF